MFDCPTARARLLALLVALGIVVVACGGNGDKATLDAPTPPNSTDTSTVAPTRTSTVDGPKSPLTGLVATDPTSLGRPALIVKIDNADGAGCDDAARPQIGISHAETLYDQYPHLRLGPAERVRIRSRPPPPPPTTDRWWPAGAPPEPSAN